jgi:hypothetical protein
MTDEDVVVVQLAKDLTIAAMQRRELHQDITINAEKLEDEYAEMFKLIFIDLREFLISETAK